MLLGVIKVPNESIIRKLKAKEPKLKALNIFNMA